MKIKINYDPEGVYNDEPMEAEQLIEDYIVCNDLSCNGLDSIERLIINQANILISLNFIADLWGLNYEICD